VSLQYEPNSLDKKSENYEAEKKLNSVEIGASRYFDTVAIFDEHYYD